MEILDEQDDLILYLFTEVKRKQGDSFDRAMEQTRQSHSPYDG